MAANIVYTIGHSNRPSEDFFALLKQRSVAALCDVRSHPFSRHMPHFCREALEKNTKKYGVEYHFFGREWGGRNGAAGKNGAVDYHQMAQAPAFAEGAARLRALLAADKTPALMCAEKDPLDCHRFLLVCRHLRDEGFAFRHILAGGKVETQQQAESRLLANRPALLADGGDELAQAYDWRAEEVAYRPEAAQ